MSRVRPSNWPTTSASRSVCCSAAAPSSRTTSGSSAAAIISSSRMDSAVSGVRSWCEASAAKSRSAASRSLIRCADPSSPFGHPVEFGHPVPAPERARVARAEPVRGAGEFLQRPGQPPRLQQGRAPPPPRPPAGPARRSAPARRSRPRSRSTCRPPPRPGSPWSSARGRDRVCRAWRHIAERDRRGLPVPADADVPVGQRPGRVGGVSDVRRHSPEFTRFCSVLATVVASRCTCW